MRKRLAVLLAGALMSGGLVMGSGVAAHAEGGCDSDLPANPAGIHGCVTVNDGDVVLQIDGEAPIDGAITLTNGSDGPVLCIGDDADEANDEGGTELPQGACSTDLPSAP